MLLCSLWMSEINNINVDFSTFYDYQCATFVVPKTQQINPATYVYIALEYKVWLSYLSFLLITGVLLTVITMIGITVNKDSWQSSNFATLSSSFTQVINIATSHGLTSFPVQMPLKILVISWMILSVIVGTGYSTGYTSLLAQPKYSKPINTVEDMLEQEIHIGALGDRPELKKRLLQTNNENYIALSKSFIIEKEVGEEYKNVENMKNAHFVKVRSD